MRSSSSQKVPLLGALGLASVLASSAHCNGGAYTSCGRAGPTPEVTGVEAASGSFVCDATVAALSESFDTSVLESPSVPVGDASACVYFVNDTPLGVYDITVSRAGYKTAVVRGFVVAGLPCDQRASAKPQVLTVSLTPG